MLWKSSLQLAAKEEGRAPRQENVVDSGALLYGVLQSGDRIAHDFFADITQQSVI